MAVHGKYLFTSESVTEGHPDKMAMFPSAMLHAMLRANDVMTGFLQDYFRNSLAYLDYLHQHGSSGSLKQPVHWMKAWLESWSKPTRDAQGPKGFTADERGHTRTTAVTTTCIDHEMVFVVLVRVSLR